MGERFTIRCINCQEEGKEWEREIEGSDGLISGKTYNLVEVTNNTSPIMTHHNTVRMADESAQGHFSYSLEGESGKTGILKVSTSSQIVYLSD